MIDPNAPAFPTQNGCKNDPGMTIRATMAMHIMSGLLSNAGGPIQANGMNGWNFVNCNADHVAQAAVGCADALIAELNKEKP